jgi:hypothetical protein
MYKIIRRKEDFINTITDGELNYISFKSSDMDSKDAIKRWKKKLYEVSKRRHMRISVEGCEELFG